MLILTFQIVLAVLIGGALGYLCLLSLLAYRAKPVKLPDVQRKRFFAVVVPAHNEELHIEETVRDLRVLEYPPDRFEVIVVADNCIDRTSERARRQGATVLERVSAVQKGKGYALRWCFDRLLIPGAKYDAVVVCDADTSASPNLLAVMNCYLEQGALAVQCNDQVRPAPDAWSSEATRLGFLLYNYVRPAGRKRLGCSAGLRGNGMCFATSLLQAIPWESYSRNEDLEYGLMLLLKNTRVIFAPEATVLATMPLDSRNAESQRARWEGGRFSIIKTYTGPLIAQAVVQRSFVILDGLIDLLTPAFVNLMVGASAMLLISTALWLGGNVLMGRMALVWICVFGLGAGHLIFGVLAARSEGGTMALVRHVPRYVIWKLRLYTRMIFAGDSAEWVRTTRESQPDFQKRGQS